MTGATTVAKVFGHEKLKGYQKGMNFVAIRGELLAGLPRRVSACDHLDRGTESVLVNMAHASSSWSPKDRIVYLGHSNGSALEYSRGQWSLYRNGSSEILWHRIQVNSPVGITCGSGYSQWLRGRYPSRRRTRTVKTYRGNVQITIKGRGP